MNGGHTSFVLRERKDCRMERKRQEPVTMLFMLYIPGLCPFAAYFFRGLEGKLGNTSTSVLSVGIDSPTWLSPLPDPLLSDLMNPQAPTWKGTAKGHFHNSVVPIWKCSPYSNTSGTLHTASATPYSCSGPNKVNDSIGMGVGHGDLKWSRKSRLCRSSRRGGKLQSYPLALRVWTDLTLMPSWRETLIVTKVNCCHPTAKMKKKSSSCGLKRRKQ